MVNNLVELCRTILTSHPSLAQVRAEQSLRRAKLELSASLLQLRTAPPRPAAQQEIQTDMITLSTAADNFADNVKQFLLEFGAEITEEEALCWNNDLIDVQTKVEDYKLESMKHAKSLDAFQYCKELIENGVNSKDKLKLWDEGFEKTVLEMCMEVNEKENNVVNEEKINSKDNPVVTYKSYFPALETIVDIEEEKDDTENMKYENEFIEKNTKISYRRKKEITSSTTVTEIAEINFK